MLHARSQLCDLHIHQGGVLHNFLITIACFCTTMSAATVPASEKELFHSDWYHVDRLQYLCLVPEMRMHLLRRNSAHACLSSQGRDHGIRYHTMHDNKYIRYFTGHTELVTALCLCPLTDLFLSSGEVGSCLPALVCFPRLLHRARCQGGYHRHTSCNWVLRYSF